MPQSVTPARRLAIIALARLSGPAQAAKTGKVDVRTVRRWLDEEGDVDHDEQEWQAAHDIAQERHLTALLTGAVTGAVAWATSAGVSARNSRYARLIRSREAQRQKEAPVDDAPDPVAAAIAALDEQRRTLMGREIDLSLVRRFDDDEPSGTADDDDAVLLKWIANATVMTDDEVALRLVEVEAELRQAEAQLIAAAQAARIAPPAPVTMTPDPEPPEAPGEPVAAASPIPGLHLLEGGRHLEDHYSWRGRERDPFSRDD